ncbi:MAG: dephospho-CoA kinase, partial [bacterium]
MIISPVKSSFVINNISRKNEIRHRSSSIFFTARTLAITGNIAAGKSTVQELFEKKGIPCIDVDHVVHELYNNDNVVIQDVKKIFADYGFHSLKDDDFIDRSKIRDIVFQNEALKRSLEDIVHPAVERRVEEFIQKNKSNKNVAIFNPLLFETNKQSHYDYVVLIKIDPQEQLKRLLSRNSFLTPETAIQRINSQMPQFLKESRADFVIDNSKGTKSVEKQVDTLISKLNGTFTPNNSNLFIGIPFLKYTWDETLKQIGIKSVDISEGFSSVISAYDDKSRSYHGIKHIEKMLKELKNYEI